MVNSKTDLYANINFVEPNKLQMHSIQYKNSYTYVKSIFDYSKKTKIYNDTMKVVYIPVHDHCFDLKLYKN